MDLFIIFLLLIILTTIFISYNKISKKKKLQLCLESNFFIEEIKKTIERNKFNLLEERKRLKSIDAYGNENLKRWFGKPPINKKEIKFDLSQNGYGFKEGIPYFWFREILKSFESIDIFFSKWEHYIRINPTIRDEILGKDRKLQFEDWYLFIASMVEKSCINLIDEYKYENNLNNQKGIAFENQCMKILISKGWRVEETPKSGDQGIDLIASIEKYRLCIQCKDHKKPIGNKAVQEVSAGKKYWNGTHAILVSQSGYTKSAYKLAAANNVLLISTLELNNIVSLIT
tara:strand:+ start:2493 stop:3353 length:861 start_codon:yes stop_codon:yes gene_type:complete